MSERITEAELLYWETTPVARVGQLRLVAEVRRLRTLISDWHSPEHDEKRLWPALEDEARAIRDEGLTSAVS